MYIVISIYCFFRFCVAFIANVRYNRGEVMAMKNTLYNKIYTDILEKIKDGRYAPGDRLPTEAELTEIYGVSRITAARAMQELEKGRYITRRQKRGSFVREYLDKQENGRAGDARIAVVLQFERSIGLGIMFGAQSAASSNTYFTTFHHTENNPKNERAILKKLLSAGDVAGLVLCPCSTHENLDVLSRFQLKGIPIVFLDRAVDGISAPLVTSDNENGMREVTAHLIAAGHRRIAYFPYYPAMPFTVHRRFAGFCRAFLENGCEIPSEYLFLPPSSLGARLSLSQMFAPSERYIDYAIDHYEALAHMPTAVVCANDVTADCFIRALRERGYRVPEDISVTGFDNLSFRGEAAGITTAEQDWHNFGAIAVDYVVSMIEGREAPPVTLLKTRYMEKETTATPKE